MVWWGFAVVLVEADWFEAFRVDVEAELSSECWKIVNVGWSLESFLEGMGLLPGVDGLPRVIPCSRKIVKLNERGVL